MLTSMDTGVPAAGPWTVLALAVLALVGVGVVLLRGRRPPPRSAPRPPAGPRHDDLPGFLEHPPGTGPSLLPQGARARSAAPVPLAGPGAVASLAPPPVPPPRAAPVVPPRTAPPAAGLQVVAAMAAGALALIALAAVVVLVGPARADAPSSAAGTASTAPPSAPRRVALPALPAAPAPGRPAGQLAATSLPLGGDGEEVHLRFGGVVLAPRAVGVTATYPTLQVTVSGGQAVAHLQLPTQNCFSSAAPVDPGAAGCVASLSESADLPSPALRVARSGHRLTLAGRFPTYTRPDGSGAAYTGRVYAVQITVVTGQVGPDGRAAATGMLTLGQDSAASLGDPGTDAALFGR